MSLRKALHERSLSMSNSKKKDNKIRLNFSSLPIYGRDKEQKEIIKTYGQVCEKGGSSRLLLVHGLSGSGKSALITETLREPIEATDAFYGTGKFDQYHFKPYSAVADAFSMLLLSVKEQLTTQLRKKVQKALGDEAWALVALMPPLTSILSDDAQQQQQQSDNQSIHSNYSSGSGSTSTFASGAMSSMERSLYLFRKLLRALATPKHPIIFFLDDLQWADASSLDLFRYLIQDTDSQNVLFVGSYRYNQPEHEHWLSEKLLGRLATSTTTIIRLEDLDFDSVQLMITEAVDVAVDDGPAERLTAIVYNKTKGNCFFVVQFLQLLQDLRYMYYSEASYKWEWDLDSIVTGTHGIDNVEDLLRRRIQKLPRSTQSALTMAAFLGFVFEPSLLSEIVMSRDPTTNATELSHSLYLLYKAGMLEKGHSMAFKFAHDRVQQTAYQLIDNPVSLHWQIGCLLRVVWKEQEKQKSKKSRSLFFAMVDQLNQGAYQPIPKEERLDLIHLNMQAGMEAKRRCDFLAAAAYVEKGIELLHPQQEVWSEEYYSLTLELYSYSTEFYLASGKLEECKEAAGEVLHHAKTLQDRLRANLTLVRALGTNGYLDGAIQEGFRVLKMLHHDFPTKPTRQWHVLPEIAKTRKLLRKFTDSALLQLPVAREDHDQIIAVKLMTSLAFHLYTTKEGEYLLPLLKCRMVQITLKVGLCSYAPYAFAAYASALIAAGRPEECKRYATLALHLLDRLRADHMFSAVMSVLHSSVIHWRDPFNCSLDPLLTGYRIGMRTGNFDHAIACANTYAIVYYNSGWNLRMLHRDLKAFINQSLSYRQSHSLAAMAAIRQLALNLRNSPSSPVADPLVLTGEAMDQKVAIQDSIVHKNSFTMEVIMRARLELAYLLNSPHLQGLLEDFETCGGRININHAGYVRRVFLLGLCYMRLSRLGPKYRRKAKNYMDTIEKWCSTNLNCVHMALLLKAEWYANNKLNPNHETCKEMYNEAIAAAMRAGCTHDEAVATERAGDVCAMLYEWSAAEAYYIECHRLYGKWGAGAKQSQLEALHKWMTPETHNNVSSSSSSTLGSKMSEGVPKSVHVQYNQSALQLPSPQQHQLVVGSARRHSSGTLVEPDCEVRNRRRRRSGGSLTLANVRNKFDRLFGETNSIKTETAPYR